jgi:hypothetical protein
VVIFLFCLLGGPSDVPAAAVLWKTHKKQQLVDLFDTFVF